MTDTFTVPGLGAQAAETTSSRLQERLVALIDTTLTLKHIHWNVVGPTFIGVHEMLDPQYKGVAKMVDQIAERIAALGGSPNGLPGYLVEHRQWDDYGVNRARVPEHLEALDHVYTGLIADHRRAIDEFETTDKVTQDMIIGQTEKLEQYQWFVRAHLEDGQGRLSSSSSGQRGAGQSTSANAKTSSDTEGANGKKSSRM